MPEGHTLHALAGRLSAAFAGEPVRVSSPQGRFAAEAALLDGLVLEGAQAYGKHLALEFAGDQVVHVHLGLFGKFGVQRYRSPAAPAEVPVSGVVRLRLLGAEEVADLRGATVCRLLAGSTWRKEVAGFGADPLRRRTLPAKTLARLTATVRPVGAVMMDQSFIAGVGNVYRAEVLHLLAIDPHLASRQLGEAGWRHIWKELVRLMPLGVASGRIVVAPADVRRVRAQIRRGETPRIDPSYAVYRRHGEPCPRCGAIVVKEEMVARNLFWCPGCQVGRGITAE
ncbi:MAG: zinc finger domain-containing protein [Nocardioides sp.]